MLTFGLVAESVALVEELPHYFPNLVSDLVGLVNYLICPCPVIAAEVEHHVGSAVRLVLGVSFEGWALDQPVRLP